jgi:hypothetical protein
MAPTSAVLSARKWAVGMAVKLALTTAVETAVTMEQQLADWKDYC